MEKAAALREVGRNDDAIRAYDSMLDDEPRDVEVLERKKDALIAKGDHEGIIAICDVLLQIDPLSKSAHVDRGDALSSIGRLDDAAAEYQYALRVDPSGPLGDEPPRTDPNATGAVLSCGAGLRSGMESRPQ